MPQTGRSYDLTPEQKARQESFKLLFDVYKHITTLSTGAIVILATFLEKFFKAPQELYLVAISVTFFLVAIATALIMMAHLALEQQINRRSTLIDRVAKKFVYIMAPAFFFMGTACLAVFAAKNFSL